MRRMKSTGEMPPWPPRGAVTPPATRAARLTALMLAVRGVEELLHVGLGRRRLEPDRLVRLVPDHPPRDEAVAERGLGGELGEDRSLDGRDVRAGVVVRPPGRAPQRHHRLEAVGVERAEQPVGPSPVVVTGRALDAIPAEGHADRVEAQTIELRDAVGEPSGAELEPGVVLDAELDTARRLRPTRSAAPASRQPETGRARASCVPHTRSHAVRRADSERLYDIRTGL